VLPVPQGVRALSPGPGQVHYLSRAEVARRIGVTPGALSRYKLPPPDATIGDVRGWFPATIDAWNAARPGRGARTDLRRA
jgi:hypothetical protein